MGICSSKMPTPTTSMEVMHLWRKVVSVYEKIEIQIQKNERYIRSLETRKRTWNEAEIGYYRTAVTALKRNSKRLMEIGKLKDRIEKVLANALSASEIEMMFAWPDTPNHLWPKWLTNDCKILPPWRTR